MRVAQTEFQLATTANPLTLLRGSFSSLMLRVARLGLH